MAYTSQGHKAVGTADGNVDHLGQKHPPLFAAAVATLLLLWLPYTLYSYSTLPGSVAAHLQLSTDAPHAAEDQTVSGRPLWPPKA